MLSTMDICIEHRSINYVGLPLYSKFDQDWLQVFFKDAPVGKDLMEFPGK